MSAEPGRVASRAPRPDFRQVVPCATLSVPAGLRYQLRGDSGATSQL